MEYFHVFFQTFMLLPDNVESAKNQPIPWLFLFQLSGIFFLYSWAFKRFVAEKVFRAIATEHGKSTSNNVLKPLTLTFGLAHIDFQFYFVFLNLGIIIGAKNPFLFRQDHWFSQQPSNSILPISLRVYYIAYAARYISLLFLSLTQRGIRPCLESLVHCIATINLVLLSYAYGWVKVGIVLMVIMDLAEPFLHFGKQVYCFQKLFIGTDFERHLDPISNFLFTAFSALFFLTRIIMFPCIFYLICEKVEEYQGLLHNPRKFMKIGFEMQAMYFALITLLLLQLSWFHAICCMLLKRRKDKA